MMEKQQQARDTVKRYTWFAAGAGLIPIQYVDGLAVTGLQLKMIAEISKIYDIPFRENEGKAAIAAMACFIIPHAAAFGALAKAIPGVSVLGAPLAAAFAGTYSWVLGNIFVQHFESGGTLINFHPEHLWEDFKSKFVAGGVPWMCATCPAKADRRTPKLQPSRIIEGELMRE
jgi:uncharacterized protein (DUF697 family)